MFKKDTLHESGVERKRREGMCVQLLNLLTVNTHHMILPG